MGTIVGLNDLADALIRVGYNLVKPHSSTEELLTLLDETESLLRNVGQDQPLSMQNALIPSKTGLVSADLMNHPDSDVRVSVVTCLTEILRIAAPEAPYSDDEMKEIFRLTVEAFEKLADASSRSYKKAESVLDSVSKVRSCLVMLDLECYDLILQMFRSFLKIIRSDHSRAVFSAMEMIMILVIDETEEISNDLLDTLLASVKKENQTLSPMSWSLGEKVLSRCAHRLKPYIIEALKSAGTSLDMYSPVVTTVCQSVHTDPPKVHNVVNTEVNEAAEPKLGRQVAPRDSSEDKLDLGDARKEIRSKSSSKRPVREGTHRIRINGNDNVRNGNSSNLLKQSLKEVRSESTDAEAELGVTGKSGRRVKPNSLMNPDEGYDIPWLSGKRESLRTSSNSKLQIKGSGGESSLRKVAMKKRPLPKETSPATSSRALTGSVKRSRVTIDESDHDLDSLSSPRLKKLASCFRDEVPREKESNQESDEIPEDDEKIGNSSKKTRSQNGLEKSQKTAQKKSIVEAKIVNSSGKRTSARTEAKRKNSEAASQETPVPQSSKSKKMVSQVAARQVAEESEKTSKSHPTRNRTARKEVESDTFGEDLVGKRVNIWWPLDKRYYEGVVESYSSRKKLHRVVYLDGDSEALNLVKERWELLEEDHTSDSEDMEIDDLPESIPLINLMKRQKLKKSKNAGVSVEPTSSSGVRSSSRTVTKKDSGKKGNKQAKRGKGASKAAVVIEKPEKTREGKNLKSLKELNAETERTEEQEVDHDNEVDDYSDKQEQSEDKSEEESLKSADTEAESKEEDKQSPTSEAESERKSSESEEEPKWRDTDDMEVEAEEEKEEVSDKGTDTNLSETDKEEDEEERDMEDEAEEVDGKVTNTNLSETDKEEDEEERDVEEEAEEREEEVDDKVTNTNLSETEKEEDEERAMEDDAEEVDDKVINTSLSEIEKEEGEEKDMEDEATEREEVDGKVSEIEKEEDEERALEAEAEEGDDKVSEIEKEEDEVRAMEAEAEEVDDKVTNTNLSEIEKEEGEGRAMEEAEKIDDKVTNTNVSEIEKEDEEERRES